MRKIRKPKITFEALPVGSRYALPVSISSSHFFEVTGEVDGNGLQCCDIFTAYATRIPREGFATRLNGCVVFALRAELLRDISPAEIERLTVRAVS